VARDTGIERPTLGHGLLDGEKVSSGPYSEYKVAMKTAMLTEYVGNYRRHLFRSALEQGLFDARVGRRKVTLPQVADWTGYSLRVLKAWLQPMSSRTRRTMPLPAIRLIIHEFWMRDGGHYDWEKMLRKCR
jgi:hypothetical protein